MQRSYGADPIPPGAAVSVFGPEKGRAFQGGAAACGFAFQHPEGYWEIDECDVDGMPDVNGEFQPQAVTIPCPTCNDALRLTQDRKPFRLGSRRVLRLPGPDGRPRAVVISAPITVDSRIVCGMSSARMVEPLFASSMLRLIVSMLNLTLFYAIMNQGLGYPDQILTNSASTRNAPRDL